MIIFALLAIILILLLFVLVAILHSVLGLILFLIVAGLCAALAEYVLRVRQGVFTTVIVGLIGAALGLIVRFILHLPAWWSPAGVPVVWTILGSFIVVVILRLVVGNRRPRWI